MRCIPIIFLGLVISSCHAGISGLPQSAAQFENGTSMGKVDKK
jgi:hypothetical protein